MDLHPISNAAHEAFHRGKAEGRAEVIQKLQQLFLQKIAVMEAALESVSSEEKPFLAVLQILIVDYQAVLATLKEEASG